MRGYDCFCRPPLSIECVAARYTSFSILSFLDWIMYVLGAWVSIALVLVFFALVLQIIGRSEGFWTAEKR